MPWQPMEIHRKERKSVQFADLGQTGYGRASDGSLYSCTPSHSRSACIAPSAHEELRSECLDYRFRKNQGTIGQFTDESRK